MVEIAFQMYACDNYKNSFLKNDLICHVSRSKSQDEWPCSFVSKGNMCWCHLPMNTTVKKSHTNILVMQKHFCK